MGDGLGHEKPERGVVLEAGGDAAGNQLGAGEGLKRATKGLHLKAGEKYAAKYVQIAVRIINMLLQNRLHNIRTTDCSAHHQHVAHQKGQDESRRVADYEDGADRDEDEGVVRLAIGVGAAAAAAADLAAERPGPDETPEE